jgi:hypothetical protein
MSKDICPVIFVARTFKSAFWGETPQLLPMFKVICPFICIASTFKNSFWGETVQLLTMFKVIYRFIWVAKTFIKKSLGEETLQLQKLYKVICEICSAETPFQIRCLQEIC